MRATLAQNRLPATVVALALFATATAPAQQQPQSRGSSTTRVVMLGTGNPGPLPDRSGPATAIVVNNVAYLVAFGPGVVRRASAAFREKGIGALESEAPVSLLRVVRPGVER